MNNMNNFPLILPALKVEQPLGTFYAVSIDSSILRKIAYSIPAAAIQEQESDFGYLVHRSQRVTVGSRLKEIAGYIQTADAAFPNSIILGANYRENGQVEQDFEKRWEIIEEEDSNCCKLRIPTPEKLASIIDGQHRLFAFDHAPDVRMSLLCTVYLDLPMPYHAYIFSTINFNQKKVDRSLAYNLFGFSLDLEPASAWAPETFAVYLARILGSKDPSPFHNRINIGVLDNQEENTSWSVSMATVVDGILKLITNNPKRDRDIIGRKTLENGKDRKDILSIKDNSPLRNIFITGNDKAIFEIVHYYFTEIEHDLWSKQQSHSYLTKAVGIQALFDVLYNILNKFGEIRGIREEITSKIQLIKDLDFTQTFLTQASGKGRIRIKNLILLKMDVITLSDIRGSSDDLLEYQNILEKS